MLDIGIENRASSIKHPESNMKATLIQICFLLMVALFVQTTVFADEASLEAKVINVIDGVTIIVSYGGNPASCVYIGVSVPESESPLGPTSSKARQFNKDLVEGKTVRLEFDEQKYDKYGRLLAYIYCDDVFVNAELIRQGYGSVVIVSPNTKYAEHFLKLESEAREAKRGLWAEPGAMNDRTQSVALLEKQIALITKKIDELSSKIDQLFEMIKELQSQPKSVPLPAHRPEQEETDEQVKADSTEMQSDQTVYATKFGKKYHKLRCRHLKGRVPQDMTVEEAKRRGLQPCSTCFPEKTR